MINSLSLVFPFYNEEKRLPILLKKILNFNKKKLILEFIFVNDGSHDQSINIIKNFKKKNKLDIKIISYKSNKGKGYALKRGVSIASKDWILTLDIDLSVKLEQIDDWNKKKLISEKTNYIYFGSRLHKKSKLNAKKNRVINGNIFNIILRLIFSKKFLNIKDTQCGFKLYPNFEGKNIFKKISEFGFIHDVEILIIIRNLKYYVRELPVEWEHKSGSKIRLIRDSIKMFFALLRLKINYKI